jgi:hypothetical protein
MKRCCNTCSLNGNSYACEIWDINSIELEHNTFYCSRYKPKQNQFDDINEITSWSAMEKGEVINKIIKRVNWLVKKEQERS